MIGVDASVWVSFFAHDDVNHQRSRAWFQRQTRLGERYVVPRLLLVEVGASMARRTGRSAVGLNVLEQLRLSPAITFLEMSDDFVDDVAHLAIQLRVRAADAAYIAVALAVGARLVTWDREQLTRGAAVIATSTPEQELAAEDS